MAGLLPTTVGVELEYVGQVYRLGEQLAMDGWCNEQQHSYHCDCRECHYENGLLWHHQHDSTVNGEFVTRILRDWSTALLAFRVMEQAIIAANDEIEADYGQGEWREARIQPSQRTGLHVHVGTGGRGLSDAALAKYLLYERYVQRLGSGPFPDKREGMNITALDALRERGYKSNQRPLVRDAVGSLREQIAADRHVDININRNLQTVEYRVFNSTTEAWQMELAVRLALFISHGHLPRPTKFRMPARAIHTLIPALSYADFLNHFIAYDPLAEELIERHRQLYPEPEDLPDDDDYDFDEEPAVVETGTPIDDSGALLGCDCPACQQLREERAHREQRVEEAVAVDPGFTFRPGVLNVTGRRPNLVIPDASPSLGTYRLTSDDGYVTWQLVDDEPDEPAVSVPDDPEFEALLAEEQAIANRHAMEAADRLLTADHLSELINQRRDVNPYTGTGIDWDVWVRDTAQRVLNWQRPDDYIDTEGDMDDVTAF